MNIRNKFFRPLLLVAILFSTQLMAQEKPAFWNDIQKFKQQDSIAPRPKGGILFVGSSSFTMWKDLEQVFKDYQAINRGFGGSTLLQANYYIKDIVFPYKPRQIVIYSGENDIASDGVSALEVLKRFADFFTHIRNQLPGVPVIYISIKSSPSRIQYSETMNHANMLIRDYLKAYKNTHFVDVNSKMLSKTGQPRPELFLQDQLHMKPAGYAIWIKELRPYLLKN